MTKICTSEQTHRLKKNQTWNRQYTTRAALYIPAGKESSAFLAETALLANWQSYS